MSLPFNIAIDGHSSCGKSTIAKSIANKYGMRYVDTGAMYRAVTLYCIRNKIISNARLDFELLIGHLSNISIDFHFNVAMQKSETFLNNKNVEHLIRGFDVSQNVSIVSQVKEVRDKLIVLQKKIGKKNNVVMDGRDIGTKVFPNAKLKLFVTAKVEVRAQRRFDELIEKGEDVTFDEILANLNDRDMHDTNRKINPLLQAKDAILIDNSYLSIQEQDIFIDGLINNKKA